MNGREKGKRGERAWRDELVAHGYIARRGRQFSVIEAKWRVRQDLNLQPSDPKLVRVSFVGFQNVSIASLNLPGSNNMRTISSAPRSAKLM